MVYCSCHLDVGNFSLDTRSVPQHCQTLGLTTSLVCLWMCFIVQDSVQLPFSLYTQDQACHHHQYYKDSLRLLYPKTGIHSASSIQLTRSIQYHTLPGGIQLTKGLLNHALISQAQWHIIWLFECSFDHTN